jgi:hypothetical protein
MSKTRWSRGLKDGLVLSGSWIYAGINDNRDAGAQLRDGMEAAERGAPPASLVGPNTIYMRDMPKSAAAEAAKHQGFMFLPIDSIDGLMSAIAMGFYCVVAVQAGSGFSKVDSQGIARVDRGNGNHAIHCDDLVVINNEIFFDCPNNWGIKYGVRGRAYLPRESFEQTAQVHQFWALISTHEAGL